MRPTNDIQCKPFSKSQFRQEVWERSSGRTSPPAFTPPQVLFLAAHLKSLGASSLLIETHYVDRHYVEEVGLYYSRCLGFSGNACARIHAFTGLGEGRDLHEDGRLSELLRLASQEGPARVEELLQPAYLGYVVVRPQPSVPIGRSVLKPPEIANTVWAQSEYGAHVMGLSLRVHGLAFQQQDRAVGACATTAVWTALQQTCKREADRPPTPSAITQAAVRYQGPVGRILPSSGLTMGQICEAFRSFEFPPDVFDVRGDPKLFKLQLNAYLRSGIPVLLAIRGPGGGHAVTVVGFKSLSGGPPAYSAAGRSITCLNLGFDEIYVHDDRIGPYARAEIQEVKVSSKRSLCLTLWDEKKIFEKAVIHTAAAPLYPKLRSTAFELLEASLYLLPAFKAATAGGKRLAVELFFQRSGDYLTELYRLPADAQRLSSFQRRVALSRYVGVSRWYQGNELVLDAIWDTTDTLREETLVQQFWLGLVAFRATDYDTIDLIADYADVVSG